MNRITFPSQPQKRRLILVLSAFEYERLQYEDWGNPLLRDAMNGKLYILVSEFHEQNPIVQNIILKGLDNEGTLLIQNPYDISEYEAVDNISSTFPLAKWSHFVNFCDYLGVQNVFIEQVEITSLSGRSIYKGKLGIAIGNVNGDVKNILGNIQKQALKIQRTVKADDVQRDIIEAEKYFNEHLSGDAFIKNLLNIRPTGSYSVECSLTQEIKRTLDIAASLNLPQIPGNNLYMNLRTSINKVTKESYEFKLNIKIEF